MKLNKYGEIGSAIFPDHRDFDDPEKRVEWIDYMISHARERLDPGTYFEIRVEPKRLSPYRNEPGPILVRPIAWYHKRGMPEIEAQLEPSESHWTFWTGHA